MITTQGNLMKETLIIGIEYKGVRHKEFELRPQIVRDSIEAVEDERARSNESYLGLCMLAKQIESLGTIPKNQITPELLLDMYEVDLSIMTETSRRLQEQQRSFRGENQAPKKSYPCIAEDRV